MVASTDIKFYVHTNTNAPQLTNNFGCMIDVLDACLVNGFGSQTVSTLTASGTTVTATFGSAHKFMQYQVIKIVGANQTEYNGEHRILTVPNANTITFELAAAPSVTTATGTITCSLPPLGWEKPFSSSNPNGGGKAAYRSTNLLLPSRPFLRVVDELDPVWTSTYAKYAKVGIVEDMSDIDTMIGVQPNLENWIGSGAGSSAVNGINKWYYARTDNETITGQNVSDTFTPANGNRIWVLVGSGDYFYILPSVAMGSNSGFSSCYGFGSFTSFVPIDNSNNFLLATIKPGAASNTNRLPFFGSLTNNIKYGISLQRKYDISEQQSVAKTISFQSPSLSEVLSGSSDLLSPKSTSGSQIFFPSFILEDQVLRGELPGVKIQMQRYSTGDLSTTTCGKDILLNKNVLAYSSANSSLVFGQVSIKIGEL